MLACITFIAVESILYLAMWGFPFESMIDFNFVTKMDILKHKFIFLLENYRSLS